ncbi:MAG: hypothetical protein ACRBCI_14550 [Cellvibrionaceae bacterium]
MEKQTHNRVENRIYTIDSGNKLPISGKIEIIGGAVEIVKITTKSKNANFRL